MCPSLTYLDLLRPPNFSRKPAEVGVRSSTVISTDSYRFFGALEFPESNSSSQTKGGGLALDVFVPLVALIEISKPYSNLSVVQSLCE